MASASSALPRRIIKVRETRAHGGARSPNPPLDHTTRGVSRRPRDDPHPPPLSASRKNKKNKKREKNKRGPPLLPSRCLFCLSGCGWVMTRWWKADALPLPPFSLSLSLSRALPLYTTTNGMMTTGDPASAQRARSGHQRPAPGGQPEALLGHDPWASGLALRRGCFRAGAVFA